MPASPDGSRAATPDGGKPPATGSAAGVGAAAPVQSPVSSGAACEGAFPGVGPPGGGGLGGARALAEEPLSVAEAAVDPDTA